MSYLLRISLVLALCVLTLGANRVGPIQGIDGAESGACGASKIALLVTGEDTTAMGEHYCCVGGTYQRCPEPALVSADCGSETCGATQTGYVCADSVTSDFYVCDGSGWKRFPHYASMDTCGEFTSIMTDTTGTCGDMVLSVSPTLTEAGASPSLTVTSDEDSFADPLNDTPLLVSLDNQGTRNPTLLLQTLDTTNYRNGVSLDFYSRNANQTSGKPAASIVGTQEEKWTGADDSANGQMEFRVYDGNNDWQTAMVLTGSNGYVGVGVPSSENNQADTRLEVVDASGPQLKLTNVGETYETTFETDSSGYLVIKPTNKQVGINNTPAHDLDVHVDDSTGAIRLSSTGSNFIHMESATDHNEIYFTLNAGAGADAGVKWVFGHDLNRDVSLYDYAADEYIFRFQDSGTPDGTGEPYVGNTFLAMNGGFAAIGMPYPGPGGATGYTGPGEKYNYPDAQLEVWTEGEHLRLAYGEDPVADHSENPYEEYCSLIVDASNNLNISCQNSGAVTLNGLASAAFDAGEAPCTASLTSPYYTSFKLLGEVDAAGAIECVEPFADKTAQKGGAMFTEVTGGNEILVSSQFTWDSQDDFRFFDVDKDTFIKLQVLDTADLSGYISLENNGEMDPGQADLRLENNANGLVILDGVSGVAIQDTRDEAVQIGNSSWSTSTRTTVYNLDVASSSPAIMRLGSTAEDHAIWWYNTSGDWATMTWDTSEDYWDFEYGLRLGESLWIEETAAADTDYAGVGQIWVKNDTPNTLWFTNDAGTDTQLGAVGPTGPTGPAGAAGATGPTGPTGSIPTLIDYSQENLTASQANSGKGPQMGSQINVVTSCLGSPGGGVQLPTIPAGERYQITLMSDCAGIIGAYPGPGESIDPGAVDGKVNVSSASVYVFTAVSDSKWIMGAYTRN